MKNKNSIRNIFQYDFAAAIFIFCMLLFTFCGGGGGGNTNKGGGQVVSSSKAIIAFYFVNPAATGIINQINHTISVIVPNGTDVSGLIATFTSTGTSEHVVETGLVQTSGVTANNFINPVTYRIIAEDNTTQNYTVTVNVAASSAKAITSFSFLTNPVSTGIINEANHSIIITVPYGTDRASLVPNITHTGDSINPASGTARNFTNPGTYTVTAKDASTQNYTVTAIIAANDAKAITSFKILNPAAIGIINEINHAISVPVPYGTNLASLTAIIAHTGSLINPESGEARNFTNSVTYTVTAANLSTQDYSVTVTVAPNSAKAITSFTFDDPAATGIINETSHTIAVAVPYGTDVTSLVPAITHTGASISPASGTARDFTNAVVYTVRAADSSTQIYTVTVGRLAEVVTAEIAENLILTPNITGTYADGGGNVLNEGSSSVTERGIVWNTSGYPTTNDSKAIDGNGPGEFTSASLINLVQETIYYVRAYAINSQGTSYGDQISFNSGKEIGSEYEGGYVFYNNGNGGGLVCAVDDQSASYAWITGGSTRTTQNGNTLTDIGSGLDNSKEIVAQPWHTGSAASICHNYDDGSYEDWFLPSIDELDLMYYRLQNSGFGDFAEGIYWSSSEDSATNAWGYDFSESGDDRVSGNKQNLCRVRAVRVF